MHAWMPRDRERFDEIGKKIKRESDVASSQTMGRRQILAPPGGTLNTVTPCAACKLLRRRCADECPFSPYFSPHEPHKFAAVHKVFGASNVSKMLTEVPESQRADAANSLVYEANLRIRDPVYGCMGAISTLQQQIETLQAELNAVRAEILKYKYTEAPTCNIAVSSSSHAALVSPSTVSVAIPSSPQPLPTRPRPPPPRLSPVPVVVSSSCSSSSSSLLTSSVTATDYSSISTDNVQYYC